VGVPLPDHPVVSLAKATAKTNPEGKPTSMTTPNKKESWRTIAFTALTDWVNVLRHDDDGEYFTENCPGVLIQEKTDGTRSTRAVFAISGWQAATSCQLQTCTPRNTQ
jgi:hypothetical protein